MQSACATAPSTAIDQLIQSIHPSVDPSFPFLVQMFQIVSRPFFPRFFPFFARFHRLAEAVPTSPKPEPQGQETARNTPRGVFDSGPQRLWDESTGIHQSGIGPV